MGEQAWSAEASGVAIHLRLTPKGGRDAIEGVELLSDSRKVLKARVRAAPENGKANAALIELVAESIGVAKSAVRLVAGETSRVKKIFVVGDPAILTQALERLAHTEKAVVEK